jgi:hypothetical protein
MFWGVRVWDLTEGGFSSYGGAECWLIQNMEF